MSAFSDLIEGMAQGRSWDLIGNTDSVKQLLAAVYDERCHRAAHHRDRYQHRVNLQKNEEAASYAGWITAENPSSGPYQGTSLVWFPGAEGSVAVLVIGTDGFGSDTAILGRPGHGRRLRALSRLHRGRIWVKPDLLDVSAELPAVVAEDWPAIPAAQKQYGHVIYAAVAVRTTADSEAVADLLDLFFHEHGTPLVAQAKARWEGRLEAIASAIFPKVVADEVLEITRERRFVILDGPPGTGKTRLAYQIAERIGSATHVQFHAARTYEDFVVGLYPVSSATNGLAFEVRAGDLLVANELARRQEHILVIDEINRADLSRVLGEAIALFEVGEPDRRVRLPNVPPGHSPELQLSPRLLVLGTRNTADRSIARMDIAIRRRFAFIEMWPDLDVVQGEADPLAVKLFADALHTYADLADDEVLRLVPGHAYFLDPRPDLPPGGRAGRVARRMQYELVPLLQYYLDERLCGGASEAIGGLLDRITSRLLDR